MIYEPKGKAREYSPLAVNLFTGCGHGCLYCYVPGVLKLTRKEFDNNVTYKKDLLSRLENSARKHAGTEKQVLMSFTTDPYNHLNDELNLTREALQIFLKYKIPVAILTKGGSRVLKDFDVIKEFGEHIKVGASLTFDNELDSVKWERNAALPEERINVLKALHEHGIRTWVSLEPVIIPEQTLNLIDHTYSFVDEYQIGKLNHVKNNGVNWQEFFYAAIVKMTMYGKDYYIKEELRKFVPEYRFSRKSIEMDHLTVKGF